MLLVTQNSTKHFAKKEAGGKGFNLYLMTKNQFPVPPWIVLGASIFNRFKEETGLGVTISTLLADVQADTKNVALDIEKAIMNTDFPTEYKIFITKAFIDHGFKNVAIRSSALDEDSAEHSFAGQHSTFLFVRTEEELLSSVKKCWASAYSERSLSYRLTNGLLHDNISIAVVIQEMIPSEKSGVLFTCDPISGNPERTIINSVYGIGEGLVSGLLDADNYVVDKVNGLALDKNIVTKDKMLKEDFDNQTCQEVDVDKKLQEESSLDVDEIKYLNKLGKKIEKYYHSPQDIEWGYANGQFYILQSRPVTTKFKSLDGKLNIWDNSNIVESYGGLTLPLTFDFAHYVYHHVYVQFCEVLMVPRREIKRMDFFLKDMLGLFYGRVYYNLLNWYKLTSILPGYKYNRGFMETMMGTNESLADAIADRVRPPAFQTTIYAKFLKILTGLKFLYFHRNIQKIVDKFMSHFYKVYNEFRKKDYSTLPVDEIYEDYQKLEIEMLWNWKAPIINDYLCMVHFGIFKKLTEKWLKHLGDNFHNDLLAGNGNLESAEPTKRLIKLAGLVAINPPLKKLILETNVEDCLEAINQSEHRDFYDRVQQYIHDFGFRCMSEMKLEQKDLHQNPALFFTFLKNLLNTGQIDLEKYEVREKQIREDAEYKLDKNLEGLQKKIYTWSLHHTRKAVRNRENTRFCRTRVYGIVRSMFYGIGENYVKKGIITKKEDIFYLALDELKGSLEGTNHIQNLKKVIELRKAEYQEYEAAEPSSRFLTRGPVYWNNEHFPPTESLVDITDLADNQLKGLGCCPGVIEGTAKVVLSPDDDMELNGDILVAMRTDPGWIPLYPSASALLVERGGLLSHSAIVAREMGLPAIVSIKDLTKRVQTGMKLRINGETGLIEILD